MHDNDVETTSLYPRNIQENIQVNIPEGKLENICLRCRR